MFVFLVRSEPLRGAGVSSLADEEGMLIWECRSLAGMQLAEPRLHHFDNNLAFIKQTKLSRAAIGEEGGDGFFKGRGTDNQDEMAPRETPRAAPLPHRGLYSAAPSRHPFIGRQSWGSSSRAGSGRGAQPLAQSQRGCACRLSTEARGRISATGISLTCLPGPGPEPQIVVRDRTYVF